MSRPTGYSIASYGDMITSRPRMEAYAQALRGVVRPGCVVLDIGAGTGIFSLLACQQGAGRVHAVEPDDAIQVARAMAAANGFAGRITFHQALSTEVTLPAPVDVIVSDLRGVLPLFQHHIPAIIDARRRLLAPGGVLIPHRDTLWAALVEAPETYEPNAEPWLRNDFGLNMRAAQPLVVNTWRRVTLEPEQALVPSRRWAVLDYASIESPDVEGELAWTAGRAGIAHGLLLWFDAELADGVGFSNAPGQPKLGYGQAFFPLQAPVELAAGDAITVRLRADLTGDEYTWQWRTRVLGQGEAAQVKADFRQSTFFGGSFSLAGLRKRQAGYRPTLNDDAQVTRFVLALMDGQTALEEIAHRLLQAFPGRFSSRDEALARAGDLSARHSR